MSNESHTKIVKSIICGFRFARKNSKNKVNIKSAKYTKRFFSVFNVAFSSETIDSPKELDQKK